MVGSNYTYNISPTSELSDSYGGYWENCALAMWEQASNAFATCRVAKWFLGRRFV